MDRCEVRVKFDVPDTEWRVNWKQIDSEREREGARDQLLSGWTLWLAKHVTEYCSCDADKAELPYMHDTIAYYVED